MAAHVMFVGGSGKDPGCEVGQHFWFQSPYRQGIHQGLWGYVADDLREPSVYCAVTMQRCTVPCSLLILPSRQGSMGHSIFDPPPPPYGGTMVHRDALRYKGAFSTYWR